MSTNMRCRARGVTLLELLVVLMILSIILTAAVKTWDVTLERGRAQTTASKLDQLVKVIVGDPDYIVAGQRADFGFVGDMGRVPNNLRELVVAPSGSTLWRGPYIRSTFNQSDIGYRTDGWGDTIIYGYEVYRELPDGKESLWVRSYGGRGVADRSRWQTLFLPYSYDALTQNEVDGQIVDVRGDSPLGVTDAVRKGYILDGLSVRLYYPSAFGTETFEEYIGAPAADFRFIGKPQGVRRIVAKFVNFHWTQRESTMTTQDVPVYPLAPSVGASGILMRLSVDWDQVHFL